MKRLAILSFALALSCAHESPTKQAASATAAAHTRSDDSSEPFGIVAVDDQTDPFEKVTDDTIPFGSGIGIFQEMVPLGAKRAGVDHFARIVSASAASWSVAQSRFLAWSDRAIVIAPTERFGFENLDEYDPETKTTTPIGMRTYLLTGGYVVDHRDVADAAIVEGDEDVPEISIAMKLNAAGARKLQILTQAWAFRRIAILSHGKIEVAPVVRAPIVDGAMQLVVGPRSDTTLTRARKLVEEILQK